MIVFRDLNDKNSKPVDDHLYSVLADLRYQMTEVWETWIERIGIDTEEIWIHAGISNGKFLMVLIEGISEEYKDLNMDTDLKLQADDDILRNMVLNLVGDISTTYFAIPEISMHLESLEIRVSKPELFTTFNAGTSERKPGCGIGFIFRLMQ